MLLFFICFDVLITSSLGIFSTFLLFVYIRGRQPFCMCGPTKILISLRRAGLQQAHVIASKTDKVPEKQVNWVCSVNNIAQ